MQEACQEAIKDWFLENRRDLPWRKEGVSPYEVWVSEVMLQQTQASVVFAYFLRWMQKFPTLEDLAVADLDEVIKTWEGLGYYSRARNLHAGARQVVEQYGGNLPSSYEKLIQIKGLGRYTAGAILSFAFHQKRAALDGNGIRVLARYFAIEEDVKKSKTQKLLWEKAEAMLPEDEPWLVVEGLIELGALVCKRAPECGKCPLREKCRAYSRSEVRKFPVKGKRVPITPLERSVFVVHHAGWVLVKRGEKEAIMADLYEFPYEERRGDVPDWLKRGSLVEELETIVHHFTRFKVTLYPSFWEMDERRDLPGYEWVEVARLSALPFSSGHRKLKNQLGKRYAHFTH